MEPQLTLRGHSAAITRLIHSPSKRLLYSASLDSSIRVWALPPASHTTYAPYDETRARGELIGHTDAVWDLALVRDETTLISCGAEGAVKVWDVTRQTGGGHLKLSWGWSGLESTSSDGLQEDAEFGATAVEALKSDLKKVAVAYQNAVVKIFEIETGKEVSRLQSDSTYGRKSMLIRLAELSSQFNRWNAGDSGQPDSLTSNHVITGHRTRRQVFQDLRYHHRYAPLDVYTIGQFLKICVSGQCTHSMLAHLDGVTSLAIDPAGFSLVSGSHDCSIRFWDLLGSRACVQEITTHREKAREGVLDVEFHPSLPFMASAGADGVIKLYASS